MALTEIKTSGIADDAVTTDKLANAINTARDANTAKASITINNNADNRVITGSGTANTLNGESSVVIDSIGQVSVGGSTTAFDTTGSLNGLQGYYETDSGIATIGSYSSGGSTLLNFHTNSGGGASAERMRIDSSGRVLIGTTTEGNGDGDDLTIATSGRTGITIRSADDDYGNIFFSDSTSGASEYVGKVQYYHADNSMRFATNSNDRLIIDSSGNVGIGKTPARKLDIDTSHYVVTSSGQSTTGIHLDGAHGNAGEYGGGISFGCGGDGSAAIAARQASTSQHRVGLSFFTHDTTTSTDNAVEKVRLHDSGEVSFNDGICLGNSLTLAAANTMDDYEEGTWTPAFTGSSGSISVAGYSLQAGKYTKIGNLVYVEGELRGQVTNNSTGTYDVSGLPFTVDTNGSGSILTCFNQHAWVRAPHYFTAVQNTTVARAREGIDMGDSGYTNGASDAFNAANTDCNRVYFSGCYRTA